jgi:hypothetical protein
MNWDSIAVKWSEMAQRAQSGNHQTEPGSVTGNDSVSAAPAGRLVDAITVVTPAAAAVKPERSTA